MKMVDAEFSQGGGFGCQNFCWADTYCTKKHLQNVIIDLVQGGTQLVVTHPRQI